MKEGNIDQLTLLEAQTQALTAEIAGLQGLHEEKERSMAVHFRGRMQDALLSLSGKLRPEETVLKLRAEIEEMEEDLKRQTQMDGISLTSCEVKTLDKSASGVVQEYTLSGSFLDLQFHIEFQLSEARDKTISDMNIVLDMHNLQLSSFVTRAEESCDLLLFIRTLRSFSARCEERRRTFKHFQEKYPSVVSLPEGFRSEVMNLSHPQLPGCVLGVYWSVSVSREGVVSPQIDLLTKIPRRVEQMDTAGALDGAPEAFKSLLRLLGPEAALENLILALSIQTPPDPSP